MRSDGVDVIISANDDIKRIIRDIALNDEYKISSDDFKNMILTIIQDRNRNVV